MLARAFALAAFLLAVAGGSPTIAGKYVKKGGDFFEVKGTPQGAINLSFSGSYGMNTCSIETGPLAVRNSTAVYTDPKDATCRVTVKFKGTTARVEQHGECGCGLNVNLSGSYEKETKDAPDRHSSDCGKPQ